MIRLCEGGFTRISKTMARNLHKKGKEIFTIPCNMRFDNFYQHPLPIPNDDDFDKFVNYFEVYNCVNKQVGKYAAFYTKVDMND